MTIADAVLYDVTEAGVAVITLNRPQRMNSWGPDISAGLYGAVDDAEADPAVRVIVLTGTGRGFCAGADLGGAGSIDEAVGDGGTDVSTLVGERHPHFLTTLRKPVIAAINGACIGIGLTHALMCDIRFSAAGAKFATAFSRRGLIAEYGISWILPRLAGWGAAMDLLLSGRTFVAEEAHQLGLINDVVAADRLMERALDYAEDMAANCSPASLAVIKRQAYDDAIDEVARVSARAEALMQESLTRPDLIEGITSFLEKRRPRFPPLGE
ncbi:enoyl-CoA hydratase [Mycolicibacillus parakoreensis]|uniref:Enoyl-CoA hydratase n=1 Tax=Mycolicibacillus parakoreensis TaxID=1069221 RepID=A0ABY3TVY2_9MYCO|nr:enoyl-CoA hydratase [Mycolicibacillus parakoreensis]MCV7317030.1 enoyl-CoA hydratase [Mycolicibacillus parakoreensis]ULN51362.1 enoyl-CoA hydratase [Mycolicibacillus parakoreensis]